MRLSHIKNLIILLFPSFAFSGMFVISDSILAQLDPLWFTIVRYLPSVLIIIVVLYFIEGVVAFKPSKRLFIVGAIGIMGMTGFNVLVWIGVSLSSGVIASIFQPITPLISVAISFFFFKQKYNYLTFIIIATAFFGVLLAASEGSLAFLHSGHTMGFILIFLGFVMSVIVATLSQRFHDFSILRYSTITNTFAVLAFIIMAVIGEKFGVSQYPTWSNLVNIKWEILYAIVFCGTLPVFMWYKGFAIVGVTNGMLIMNLVPVITIVGSVLLGHGVTSYEITGASIIIFAMILHYFNIQNISMLKIKLSWYLFKKRYIRKYIR